MLNYLREKKRRALPSSSKRVSSIRPHFCVFDKAQKVSCASVLFVKYLAFKPFSPPCTNVKRVVQGGLWHGSRTEKIGDHG